MYCPKCTLEIKGEDQTSCPICGSPLVASPVESTELSSDEDLKLQELIADIDGKVSVEDETAADEVPAFEIGDESGSEPAFNLELEDTSAEPTIPDPDFSFESEATTEKKEPSEPDFSLEPDSDSVEPANYESGFSLEMEDKPLDVKDDVPSFSLEDDSTKFSLEPDDKETGEPSFDLDAGSLDVPEQPLDEPSIDFEKGLSLDDDMGTEAADLESSVNNEFDLEKELGLTDEPEKDVFKETEATKDVPPSVDFDNLPLTEEEQGGAEIEEPALEPDLTAEPYDPGSDAKDMLDKTLEELDPIGEMEKDKKKSSKTSLLIAVCIILLVAAGGISYMMKKSETGSIPEPVVVKKKAAVTPKKAVKPKPAKPIQKKPVVKKEVVEKKVPVKKEVVKPVEVKEPPKPVVKKIKTPVVQTVTYSIHAGSFRKKELAQTEINRFGKSGFNGYIERVNLGSKGVWYRVKIGLYDTRAEAKTAEKKLLKKVKAETRIVKNK